MAVDVLSQFFLRKLEQGFELKKEVLSERDHALLLTVVERVDQFPITIEEARYLVERYMVALRAAFEKEIPSDPEALARWRDHNIICFRAGNRLLDCVVQRWYILYGRAQERKIRFSPPLYTWYSPTASKLWDAWCRVTKRHSAARLSTQAALSTTGAKAIDPKYPPPPTAPPPPAPPKA